MIGNTIKFLHYNHNDYSEYERNRTNEERERIGLVVDAFTEIKGYTSGSTEVFLGFGAGKTSGSTESKRVYKVEYTEKYLGKRYINIYERQLLEILSYAGQPNQEINEEKFK